MHWKRPEIVPFPSVWLTFEAKDPDSGKIVKYKIQDLPENRYQEALHLMRTIFIRDEVICKALDRANDEVVEGKSADFWEYVLAQKITLVCFKDGSDEICGVNFLEVHEKNVEDDAKEITNKKVQNIRKTFEFIESKADPFGRYEVDKYLNARGLLVLPKYRGIGLSTEILKARVPVCRALGLKLTASTFTGIAAQKAAAKAGFVEDYSVLYDDLAKYEPFVVFPNITAPSAKFMSLRIMD